MRTIVGLLLLGSMACGGTATTPATATAPAATATAPATAAAAPRATTSPPPFTVLRVDNGDEPFAEAGQVLVWGEYQHVFAGMVAFLEALAVAAQGAATCDAMADAMQPVMETYRDVVKRVQALRPQIAPGRRERTDLAYLARVQTATSSTTGAVTPCQQHARLRAVLATSPM